MIGRILGHYEIVEPLGEGGMGAVYRARDTRLQRDVAIKVLPHGLEDDPERLGRLVREARLLAVLNHPNVATVHGLEEFDGVRFIAMEAVEGETLAEMLRGGPLPVELALTIARQIAAGLEAAHEQGIVHRDLKPANVKLTPAMKLKVLDFGIAKDVDAAVGDLTEAATVEAATQDGAILGTPAYMSPEQGRGRALDRRTDIWAFGCVLFEMLAGRRPFAGTDVSDTVAAILRDDPDWSALPANTPALIRSLLRRCLQRDPDRRLHDIADARIEIDEVLTPEGELVRPSDAEAAGPAHAPGWSRALPWAIAAAGILVGVATVALRPDVVDRPAIRATLLTGPLAIDPNAAGSIVALSPDGETLAYVAGEGTVGQIYLRRLDSYESSPVAGADSATTPFFSPDGQSLGFVSGGALRRVPVEGGSVRTICAVGVLQGAVWTEDDTIVYGDSWALGMMQVPASGGDPERLTLVNTAAGEWFMGYPNLMPNGEDVLFTVLDEMRFAKEIALLSLRTRARRTVLAPGGGKAWYVPTGHLVYTSAGALMAVPFDAESGTVTGEPDLAQEGLMMGIPFDPSFAHFAIGGNGTLVYLSGPIVDTQSLALVDRSGRRQQLGELAMQLHAPRFSPDGTAVAYVQASAEEVGRIWVQDLDRSAPMKLTLEANSFWPVWSPDGHRIAFTAEASPGLWNIFVMPSGGLDVRERLVEGPELQQPNDWSAAAETIILQEMRFLPRGADILAFRPGQDSHPRLLLGSPAIEMHGALSPDGRWLAYASNEAEASQLDVYLRSYPDMRTKKWVSSSGGGEPVWGPDSDEIFYRSPDGRRVMAVGLRFEPQLEVGEPRLLFEGPFVPHGGTARYFDISPDGHTFVLIEQDYEALRQASLRVVTGFDEVLRRLHADG